MDTTNASSRLDKMRTKWGEQTGRRTRNARCRRKLKGREQNSIAKRQGAARVEKEGKNRKNSQMVA